MPTRGDLDVGVGDIGVVSEDAAGTCDCAAGFKVPEGVSLEVGACSWWYISWAVGSNGQSAGWEKVPASQRRRHGILSVFHFCQILLIRDEEGADIWSCEGCTLLPGIPFNIRMFSGQPSSSCRASGR